MIGGLLRPRTRRDGWRAFFLGGLVVGGAAMRFLGWTVFIPLAGRSTAALAAAGLLVGFGTQLGSGCTSGHGVCGLGRLSTRSLAATVTFMAAGAATVYLVRRLAQGSI